MQIRVLEAQSVVRGGVEICTMRFEHDNPWQYFSIDVNRHMAHAQSNHTI